MKTQEFSLFVTPFCFNPKYLPILLNVTHLGLTRLQEAGVSLMHAFISMPNIQSLKLAIEYRDSFFRRSQWELPPAFQLHSLSHIDISFIRRDFGYYVELENQDCTFWF